MTIAERDDHSKNRPFAEDLGKGPGQKGREGRISRDILLIIILILTSTASFGLGMLAGRDQGPKGQDDSFWIEKLDAGQGTSTATTTSQAPPAPSASVAAAAAATSGTFVASKTGSKYYLPSCGSAKRIKEENRVWFTSKADAERAGYEPAQNCKGM